MSGHAVFVWGSGINDMASRQWNGTSWDASPTSFDLTSDSAPNWIALKPHPTSDRLMLAVVDSNSNLNTADWNGTTWTTHSEHDNFVNTDAARCVDADWEPSMNILLSPTMIRSSKLLTRSQIIGQSTCKSTTTPASVAYQA